MPNATDPAQCGRAAFESALQLGIAPTPDNFTILYEYHSGLNPELTHLINVLLTNPRRLDENVLSSIHKKFFAHARERDAVQQTSVRMQALLQEVHTMVGEAGADSTRFGATITSTAGAFADGHTTLPGLILRLRQEAAEMAERSERLGQQLSGAAERIELLERSLVEVRRDALVDGLTGLANRRSFDDRLREEAGKAMNSGEPLCLLMLDIDHFKRFNDTWGHQVGDQVLRLVGTTLGNQVRPTDFVARFGGEEFAIVMPAANAAVAAAAGERVRGAFEGRRFVARNSGTTVDGVTVSLGGALYLPGEPLPLWIERADKALYAAKHAGRNRVMMAPDPDDGDSLSFRSAGASAEPAAA